MKSFLFNFIKISSKLIIILSFNFTYSMQGDQRHRKFGVDIYEVIEQEEEKIRVQKERDSIFDQSSDEGSDSSDIGINLGGDGESDYSDNDIDIKPEIESEEDEVKSKESESIEQKIKDLVLFVPKVDYLKQRNYKAQPKTGSEAKNESNKNKTRIFSLKNACIAFGVTTVILSVLYKFKKKDKDKESHSLS